MIQNARKPRTANAFSSAAESLISFIIILLAVVVFIIWYTAVIITLIAISRFLENYSTGLLTSSLLLTAGTIVVIAESGIAFLCFVQASTWIKEQSVFLPILFSSVNKRFTGSALVTEWRSFRIAKRRRHRQSKIQKLRRLKDWSDNLQN